MPSERMTVAVLAKELRRLSARVEEGFAQVDGRFAQVDARFETIDRRFEAVDRRFDQLRAEVRSDLEEFADRIEGRFQFLMEQVRTDFKAAIDRITANTEQFAQFKREHAEEHRLIHAQIDDLDSRLPPRRGTRRRPS
jgi:uncharacterized membrane protein YccC